MDRRRFLLTSLAGAFAVSFAAEAQPPRKVPRIGFLWTGSPPKDALDAFRQGLREADYIEGQNIAIEHRSAADVVRDLPELAAELVRSRVDIVVTQGTPAANAAKLATSTIPIVMAISGDPVRTGLIASLAHPGGNITGLTLGPNLAGKRLELLKETVPNATRLTVIVDPGAPAYDAQETQAAARALGLSLHVSEVRGSVDFAKAFEAAIQARADALIVSPSPVLRFHRQALGDLAAKYRLPAMYQLKEFVEVGGLMAYGPRDADLFRRAALYVVKILRGARPADLPVEQPTKFELVINLKTAKALGLTIPPSLLARADQVID
jgi:putative ABC transport system substrate-binding protein